jgi:type III secretion system YscQ/HrcQ family protein
MDIPTSPDCHPKPLEGFKVGPYPWRSLCSVPRETIGMIRDARRAAIGSVDVSALAEALGEVVGSHVEVLVPHIDVVTEERAPSGICLALGSADGMLEVEIEIDRDLAVMLVGAVIGHRTPGVNPRTRIDSEIDGAVAAIVCRVLRRAHGRSEALGLIGPGSLRRAPGERLLRFCATVLVGNDAFSARATLRQSRAAGAAAQPAGELLASLGDLPLSLPVIAGVAVADPAEIDALEEGDVFLPGKGWTVARLGGDHGALAGTVTAAAKAHDRGVLAQLRSSGELVVVGPSGSPLDTETNMDDSKTDGNAASDAALEAPVVVRVELGAVTLTAREWAALGPGDVIPLGKRVAEPAVLRVAGIEVAEGELVEIEGELGVRIRGRAHNGAT